MSERLAASLEGPDGAPVVAELGTDVLSLLNRYDLDQVAYCGVSLGGMVGMWLAANAPERITRLGLCCTSAYMPPASMWRERAATARSEGLAPLAGPVIGRWFTPPFARDHPEAVARVSAMFTATSPQGYAGCAEAIAAMDQRRRSRPSRLPPWSSRAPRIPRRPRGTEPNSPGPSPGPRSP